jgi:hypothetical protein
MNSEKRGRVCALVGWLLATLPVWLAWGYALSVSAEDPNKESKPSAASQTPHKETDEEFIQRIKRDPEARKEAFKQARVRANKRRELNEKSLGWVLLTAEDGLIIMNNKPCPLPESFYVIPESEGSLSLIEAEDVERQQEPYARVAAAGKMAFRKGTTPEKAGVGSGTVSWPKKYTKGGLSLPPCGTILYPPKKDLRDPNEPPPNCLGWLVLAKGGDLMSCGLSVVMTAASTSSTAARRAAVSI